VPGDPTQVIYVWWDALGNYITALNYGSGASSTGSHHGADYRRWWAGADRRVHLVGKGVLRFHAVYWPAILLSAGEPLPTEILVHDYLTVGGARISKSAGTGAGNDPAELTATFGTDALRWWLLRDVPRVGDADFTVDRLIARANEDLANGLGNLVSRVVTLVHSCRDGVIRPCPSPAGTSRWLAASAGVAAPPAGPARPDGEPGRPDGGPVRPEEAPGWPEEAPGWPEDAPAWPEEAAALLAAIEAAPRIVRSALAAFDFRAATAGVWAIVEEANRFVDATEPWHLARAERAGDREAGERLDRVLGALVAACQVLAAEIWPFLPDLAARLAAACNDSAGALPAVRPLFPRIEAAPYPASTKAQASARPRPARPALTGAGTAASA
jgi:methionyl-tRNA synthetase